MLPGPVDWNGCMPKPTDHCRLKVKFSQDQFMLVCLQDGAEVRVEGFGLPLTNTSHPSEDWNLRNKPIVGNTTLVDIIQQRHSTFVVGSPDRVTDEPWSETQMPPFSVPIYLRA